MGVAPDIGAFEFSPSLNTEPELSASHFKLLPPFPNPFNPKATIQFSFNQPAISHVSIDMIDLNGVWVETLINDTFNSGTHQIQWQASHLSSGVYFLKFNAKSSTGKYIFSKTEKVLFLK